MPARKRFFDGTRSLAACTKRCIGGFAPLSVKQTIEIDVLRLERETGARRFAEIECARAIEIDAALVVAEPDIERVDRGLAQIALDVAGERARAE